MAKTRKQKKAEKKNAKLRKIGKKVK